MRDGYNDAVLLNRKTGAELSVQMDEEQGGTRRSPSIAECEKTRPSGPWRQKEGPSSIFQPCLTPYPHSTPGSPVCQEEQHSHGPNSEVLRSCPWGQCQVRNTPEMICTSLQTAGTSGLGPRATLRYLGAPVDRSWGTRLACPDKNCPPCPCDSWLGRPTINGGCAANPGHDFGAKSRLRFRR